MVTIETLRKRHAALSLPFSAKQVLSASLKKLQDARCRRAWAMPEVPFREELGHYYKRHKELNLKGPRPILRRTIDIADVEKIAFQIDSALNFLALTEGTPSSVKPILLYYAASSVCSVYCRAFFLWDMDNPSDGHGLSCHTSNQGIGNTVVQFKQRGLFPRLATTSFLFTSSPSYFTRLVTYSQRPEAHTGRGELLEQFGRQETGFQVDSMNLQELASFDLRSVRETLGRRFGFYKGPGSLPPTLFLMDFVFLYLAGSLARYDVRGWREILEGKTNCFWLHFEPAFTRFSNYAFDYILSSLQNPNVDYSPNTIAGNPYSEEACALEEIKRKRLLAAPIEQDARFRYWNEAESIAEEDPGSRS